MKNIWWINPGKLTLFFMVPLYAFMVFVVPRAWPELIVLKAGVYIRGEFAVFGLVALLALGMFALIGSRVVIDPRQSATSIAVDPVLLFAMGTLVVTAYLIWFYPVLLRGSFTADREAMNRMPGITSFTQVGVTFAMSYLAAVFVERRRMPQLVRLLFWAILMLTVLRVQLWMERLAFIELAVPIAAIVMTHRAPRTRFGWRCYRVIGSIGPFLGIPLLLLVFTATEFFRSWTTYSQTQSMPLLPFMTARLVTYYFTALNNGAGMLATQEGAWPTYDFAYTADWFYHLPFGIGAAAQEMFLRRDTTGDFLERWADVEFNNMSGIFPIVFDLGYVGATLYFCAFGFLAGVLYRSMSNGRVLGALFYGPFFVGCIEVLRISYVTGSRVVLIFVASTVVYLQMRASRSRVFRRQNVLGRSETRTHA